VRDGVFSDQRQSLRRQRRPVPGRAIALHAGGRRTRDRREHVVVAQRRASTQQQSSPGPGRPQLVRGLLVGLMLAATRLEPLAATPAAALAARLPRGGRAPRSAVPQSERRRRWHARQPTAGSATLHGGEESPATAAATAAATSTAATATIAPTAASSATSTATGWSPATANHRTAALHHNAGPVVAHWQRQAQPGNLHHLRRQQSPRNRHDTLETDGDGPSSDDGSAVARGPTAGTASPAHGCAALRHARRFHGILGYVILCYVRFEHGLNAGTLWLTAKRL